jgi:hypothetical protein
MDALLSADESLADAATTRAELNDATDDGTPMSARCFGSGTASMHPALAVDAKPAPRTSTPTIVVTTR